MFSINCLEITATKEKWKKDPSLYKNLLSESDYDNFDTYQETHPTATFSKRFFFNDFYYHEQYGDLKDRPKEERTIPDDFFGKNINIQAIVGKNGSGKSSLMDLMYMAINNFCYMFERGNDRPGADPIFFIPNIYLNLYFSIKKSGIQNLILSINNRDVFLKSKTENNYAPIKRFSLNETESSQFYKLDRECGIENISELSKLVQNFFYSIISNYSTQSFIYTNYFDKCYQHQGKNKDKENNYFDQSTSNSWINSIFHKNDGYTCPIVLNPYRNWGTIDCVNELNLSKDRLISLLIYDKQQKNKTLQSPLFEPYIFCNLYIKKRQKYLISKTYSIAIKYLKNKEIHHNWKEIVNTIKQYDDNQILDIADKWLSDRMKDNLYLKDGFDSCEIAKRAVLYYQLKIIDIINKYTNYSDFRDCIFLTIDNNNHLQISHKNSPATLRLLNQLVSDQSHITKKLKRVQNFLYAIDKNHYDFENFSWYNYSSLIKSFYNQVESNKRLPKKQISFFKIISPFSSLGLYASPMLIDACLPPSIFEYDLLLNKQNSETVNYNQLSSGELQLFQTLSIHAYHIANLLSIHVNHNNNRPKYNNFNLVFDELEICFHPEYQREFVKRLIDMLNAIVFQKDLFHFNIFLITHSPFILSDIPRSNILYMETEEDKAKNKKLPTHTFAQNIGDMMYDSFFMEKTIGDFAEEKIRKLIKKRFEKDPTKKQLLMSDAEEQAVLNCIGDPVIRSLIDEIEDNDD